MQCRLASSSAIIKHSHVEAEGPALSLDRRHEPWLGTTDLLSGLAGLSDLACHLGVEGFTGLDGFTLLFILKGNASSQHCN